MASRTGSLPRNENDKLRRRRKICAPGRFWRIQRAASDEIAPVIVVFFQPGRDREDIADRR